jgi:hypothetical protein
MAAERSFQTFSHGHQDLVLAVDFNYFGMRMVTVECIAVWFYLIFSRKPRSGPMHAKVATHGTCC